MKVGRHGRHWRWVLPLACLGLLACGRRAETGSVATHAVRQGQSVSVPKGSPLRGALRVAGVTETTVTDVPVAASAVPSGSPHHQALTVPVSALVADGPATHVYVERTPWVFEPRTVRTGLRIGSQIEIASGLAADEKVVAQGGALLER
jgi:hypothetical protein